MAVRENHFDSRLSFVESSVDAEKAPARDMFRKTSCNGDEIAAVRIEIATIGLQTERADGNMPSVKAMQASEGTMLNILTKDVREIGKEIGQMRSQMDEMRMEMGDMRTDTGDLRTGVGDIRAILDAMDRTIDARFDVMERNIDERFDAIARNVDAVLAAIHTIAPRALPAPRAAAARNTGRRSRVRTAARAPALRRSRNVA